MNINDPQISELVKKLLKSPHFILWCYTPTEENTIWWNNWMENHPGCKNDIDLAREIILSTELNKFTFSETDSKNLFLRIEASVEIRKRKRQRKLRHTIYGIAAVSIICILFSGLWLTIKQTNIQDNFIAHVAVIDSIQTEIELELGAQEKLIVVNNSTIKLDEQGIVIIDEETKENFPPQDGKENTISTNMNILKVPRGRHTMLSLADGSRVWVNSETVLEFPPVFEKNNRTIYADGEIYLEVAKDTTRPFYVKTAKMDIEVLGTSFNVTTYRDDKIQSVVLKDGVVKVHTTNGLTKSIHSNNRLVLEDNRMNVSKVDPYYYTSWIDGVFFFEKQPLQSITQRLSRYYRRNFVCAPDVENYKCTGKLVLFNDVHKVLHTLEETHPVSCEIRGNTINISLNLKQ